MSYKNTEPLFEKTAMKTKLSPDTDDWVADITNEVYKQHPFLSNKEILVDLQKINEQNNSALGIVKIANSYKKNKHITFPIIVKEGEMYPLDVMFLDGVLIPATKTAAQEYLFDPRLFTSYIQLAKANPSDALPDSMYPFSLRGKLIGDQGYNSSIKVAEDYTTARKKIESDPFYNKYLGKIIDNYKINVEKVAHKEQVESPDIDSMVMYKKGESTVAVGFSTNPIGVYYYANENLEKVASEIMENDVAYVGDEKGLVKLANLEVKTGTVEVPTVGTGILFDHVVDLTGNTLDAKLFISKDFYTPQEKIAGYQVSNKVTRKDKIKGKGTFYFTKEGETIATYPVTVKQKIDDMYQVETPTGDTYQIGFAKNINTAVKLAENKVMLPETAQFIQMPTQLRNVPSYTNEELLEAKRINISYTPQGYNIDGPALQGIEFLDVPQKVAEAIVLGAGAKVDEMEKVIKTASEVGSVRIYSDKEFVPDSQTEKNQVVNRIYSEAAKRLKTDLIKEASVIAKYTQEMSDSFKNLIKTAEVKLPEEVIDDLLSLNFVNSDNIITYVEMLPALQKTASSLANMLLGSRLGMTSIPEQPVSNSIQNLNKVIKALTSLKEGHKFNSEVEESE